MQTRIRRLSYGWSMWMLRTKQAALDNPYNTRDQLQSDYFLTNPCKLCFVLMTDYFIRRNLRIINPININFFNSSV